MSYAVSLTICMNGRTDWVSAKHLALIIMYTDSGSGVIGSLVSDLISSSVA